MVCTVYDIIGSFYEEDFLWVSPGKAIFRSLLEKPVIIQNASKESVSYGQTVI